MLFQGAILMRYIKMTDSKPVSFQVMNVFFLVSVKFNY
jgi:hypothetical protein